jgi:hypothetical protein
VRSWNPCCRDRRGQWEELHGLELYYTFKGIAPNVSLINLRVLDQNGQGTDSAVISAINWTVTNKTKYNIRVIKLPLGRPVYESYTLDPLCQAVEQAWKAGIVVVVAAGNEGRNNSKNTSGYGTITAPGNDPYVITVGAMKTMGTPSRGDDNVASYILKSLRCMTISLSLTSLLPEIALTRSTPRGWRFQICILETKFHNPCIRRMEIQPPRQPTTS